MTLVIVSFGALFADLAAQTAPAGGPQQFMVLQSEALTVPFQSLTNEQAHCAISGSGNFASMRCQAPSATAKDSYHYVAILVVAQQGMAYGIACHQSLVDLWCKKMPAGVAIQGGFDRGQKSLSIVDGQKSHSYQILTSALVGSVQPATPTKRGKAAPAPATTAASPAPQTTAAPVDAAAGAPNATPSGAKPATIEPPVAASTPPTNPAITCVPTAASCAAFVSEPAGADIYVDGKFVGSTPSTLALAPGSHEIRIEADKFKPWTRTLESTAGSTVTVHAALVKK